MRLVSKITVVLLSIVKIILWIITKAFTLLLELTKLILVLFGFVMRIFLIFVRAVIPE